MAEDLRIALQELLRKAELDSDVDFLREGVARHGLAADGARGRPARRRRRASVRLTAKASGMAIAIEPGIRASAALIDGLS